MAPSNSFKSPLGYEIQNTVNRKGPLSKTILVAYDDTEPSRRPLERAATLDRSTTSISSSSEHASSAPSSACVARASASGVAEGAVRPADRPPRRAPLRVPAVPNIPGGPAGLEGAKMLRNATIPAVVGPAFYEEAFVGST
jgi:hypothetical protein